MLLNVDSFFYSGAATYEDGKGAVVLLIVPSEKGLEHAKDAWRLGLKAACSVERCCRVIETATAFAEQRSGQLQR